MLSFILRILSAAVVVVGLITLCLLNLILLVLFTALDLLGLYCRSDVSIEEEALDITIKEESTEECHGCRYCLGDQQRTIRRHASEDEGYDSGAWESDEDVYEDPRKYQQWELQI